MKISIITVCFNSASTLESTIKSVLEQSHPDIEYIVVDGDSTDGSREIISKYRDKIAWSVSEPDSGIYDAMNKGISHATGDIIGMLNSDDIYKNKDVIKNVAAAFLPEVDCVCTDVAIFKDKSDNIIRYYSCTKWKPWMFRVGHQPPHPGFFARRSCYDNFGAFNTKYKTAADFDLLLRFIYRHHLRTLYLPWVSVLMRSGGASQAGIKSLKSANREVNISLKENGYSSNLLMVWSKYLLKIFQFGKR